MSCLFLPSVLGASIGLEQLTILCLQAHTVIQILLSGSCPQLLLRSFVQLRPLQTRVPSRCFRVNGVALYGCEVELLPTEPRTKIGPLDGVIVLVDPPHDHPGEGFHVPTMDICSSARNHSDFCAHGIGVVHRRAKKLHPAGAGGGDGEGG